MLKEQKLFISVKYNLIVLEYNEITIGNYICRCYYPTKKAENRAGRNAMRYLAGNGNMLKEQKLFISEKYTRILIVLEYNEIIIRYYNIIQCNYPTRKKTIWRRNGRRGRYLAGHEDVGCEQRSEGVGGHLVALLLLHLVEESEETFEDEEVLARQEEQQ